MSGDDKVSSDTEKLRNAIAITKRLMEDISQKVLVNVIPTQIEHGKQLARILDKLEMSVKEMDRVKHILIDGDNGDSLVTKTRLNQRDIHDLKGDISDLKKETKDDIAEFKKDIKDRKGKSHATKIAVISAAVAVISSLIPLISKAF